MVPSASSWHWPQLWKDCNRVNVSEIHDDRELYEAVSDYSNRIWRWGAHLDDDADVQPTPDELIEILNERIEWVKEHKKAVDKYCQKRGRTKWFRVIDGTGR